ncbi:MAG: Uncharacterised protein [Pseudidiomarina mangrovi]|nr:MAG: Uncharacterised protein [Pseudidiomarina mangrovi]
MKTIWRQSQVFSQAEDITRLQQHVQHLRVNFHEVIEDDRIQLIRRRWRLFAEPAAVQDSTDNGS